MSLLSDNPFFLIRSMAQISQGSGRPTAETMLGNMPAAETMLGNRPSRVAGTAARDYNDTRRPALGVVGPAGYEEPLRYATPCSLLGVVGSPVRLRGTTTSRGVLPLG